MYGWLKEKLQSIVNYELNFISNSVHPRNKHANEMRNKKKSENVSTWNSTSNPFYVSFSVDICYYYSINCFVWLLCMYFCIWSALEYKTTTNKLKFEFNSKPNNKNKNKKFKHFFLQLISNNGLYVFCLSPHFNSLFGYFKPFIEMSPQNHTITELNRKLWFVGCDWGWVETNRDLMTRKVFPIVRFRYIYLLVIIEYYYYLVINWNLPNVSLPQNRHWHLPLKTLYRFSYSNIWKWLLFNLTQQHKIGHRVPIGHESIHIIYISIPCHFTLVKLNSIHDEHIHARISRIMIMMMEWLDNI